MTQYMMFLANLFSRICSAPGQFVIVVANQCVSSGNMLRCWENLQTFRPLFSFLLRRITSLALNIEGKNINRCLGGFWMEDQGQRSPQIFLTTGEWFCHPSTAAKTRRSDIGALSSWIQIVDLKQLPGLKKTKW